MRTFIVILSALLGGTGAQSQPAPSTVAHAGTLTCTMQATGDRRATEAPISCVFQALFGRDGNFEGMIARDPGSDIPEGKRVLVWSVLAPSREVELKQLAGRYVGRSGGTGPAQLVNEQSSIVLESVTSAAQLGAEPAITVLSLHIDPLRA